MDRRRFLATTLAGTFAAPLAAEAQQPAKVARIGFLVTGAIGSPAVALSLDAFRQGLRERGYVEEQEVGHEHQPSGRRRSGRAGSARHPSRAGARAGP